MLGPYIPPPSHFGPIGIPFDDNSIQFRDSVLMPLAFVAKLCGTVFHKTDFFLTCHPRLCSRFDQLRKIETYSLLFIPLSL